ncbi:HD domain-containing protein [Limosilactobacillus fermentum]|uniref:HD domain-containing protein n=1 Tax=Limosilactobacillus fermentum TaxID=1613 RepID=UPI00062D74F7|nr:HD domain-containing protein [Limosilactobacillus fermentum]AZI18762.1 HD domain-containing protein [Limosilactobacillus fermentum]KLD54129.1 hydrolase [Limosilactobacillus fermentum]MCT3429761.1 HD domain-containing protein [Limosilactobacillus fermentum]MCT3440942.1 HD domain-containing protein [Limosilactobacillus fermentum]MDC6078807.1 HD domain-containing protein [Limosilactobacillus fermentum]
MKSKNEWRQDGEYVALVSDLLEQPAVQKLANYTQHHHSNRLQHSIAVSYDSYRLAKRLNLDYQATARAGLLHDLFYYDWRTTKFDLGTHAFIHPRVALRNAEKITSLSNKEKDIILKHMFGATVAVPRYWESLIVSLVDDYEAEQEFFAPVRARLRKRRERVKATRIS